MIGKLAAGIFAVGVIAGALAASESAAKPTGVPALAGVRVTRWVADATDPNRCAPLDAAQPLADGLLVSDRYVGGFAVIYKVEVPPRVQVSAHLEGALAPKLQLYILNKWGQSDEGSLKNRTRDVARQNGGYVNGTDHPVKVFFAVADTPGAIRFIPHSPAPVSPSDPRYLGEFQVRFSGASLAK